MSKSILAPIFTFVAMLCLASCNSSDDEIPVEFEIDWSDVEVTAFKLQKNDSVLRALDSVFFAIDLANARIYNPDSLPKGTHINKMLINVTMAEGTTAKINFRTDAGTDTVFDFVNSDNDTINFANGPVILKVTSFDEKVTLDYEIKVNVHEMVPDSLAWGDMAYTTLPGGLAATGQHTVMKGENVACFVIDAQGNLVVTENTSDALAFGTPKSLGKAPEGFDINTITLMGDDIYAVADGRLCRYDDGAWTDLAPMTWIYGVYTDNQLIGTNGSVISTWPATTTTAVPADMPVSGASEMLVYTSEWTTHPLAIIIGGTKSNGEPTGATWAYDGTSWNELCDDMPAATGMTIVPYFSFRTNGRWVVTERTTLLAFGGLKADGECQRTVYASFNRGVNWSVANQLLQLPDTITPRYLAQALVLPQTKYVDGSRSASIWTDYTLPALPRWLTIEAAAGSRATKPVTEWECPYIYLFGGYQADGTLCNDVWRGVVNRLSFAPLY